MLHGLSLNFGQFRHLYCSGNWNSLLLLYLGSGLSMVLVLVFSVLPEFLQVLHVLSNRRCFFYFCANSRRLVRILFYIQCILCVPFAFLCDIY